MTTTQPSTIDPSTDPIEPLTSQDPHDVGAADEAALGAAIGAFAEKTVLAAIGAFELATMELGMRLGLYAALADGPATPPQLAQRTGIATRYAREWLEQQATAGVVSVSSDAADSDPDSRQFALPDAVSACLLDPDSLACVAPMATFAVAGTSILPELETAFRQGTGISFGGYGEWIRKAQAAANRPQFSNLLTTDWLPALPDVVSRLESGSARVADIACGCGWSSVAIAQAYEGVSVDGFDSDEASIADARANADQAGVADWVSFTTEDAAGDIDGRYDLVCCFEALHDMAHPVDALRVMHRLASPDGAVFIVDERAADALTQSDPDPMQRFFYAASVLHCLPVGLSEEDSAGTGTVMRTATLERYADEAGFRSVEVLPVDHDMFRFYRLHP